MRRTRHAWHACHWYAADAWCAASGLSWDSWLWTAQQDGVMSGECDCRYWRYVQFGAALAKGGRWPHMRDGAVPARLYTAPLPRAGTAVSAVTRWPLPHCSTFRQRYLDKGCSGTDRKSKRFLLHHDHTRSCNGEFPSWSDDTRLLKEQHCRLTRVSVIAPQIELYGSRWHRRQGHSNGRLCGEYPNRHVY